MWRRVWLKTRDGTRGRSYSLQWYDDAGRLRQKSAGRAKKIAEQSRRAFELEFNTGCKVVDYGMKLSAFAIEHLELIQGQVTPSTLKDQRETLTAFLAHCGDCRLDRLTARTVEGYFAMRLQPKCRECGLTGKRSMFVPKKG